MWLALADWRRVTAHPEAIRIPVMHRGKLISYPIPCLLRAKLREALGGGLKRRFLLAECEADMRAAIGRILIEA